MNPNPKITPRVDCQQRGRFFTINGLMLLLPLLPLSGRLPLDHGISGKNDLCMTLVEMDEQIIAELAELLDVQTVSSVAPRLVALPKQLATDRAILLFEYLKRLHQQVPLSESVGRS